MHHSATRRNALAIAALAGLALCATTSAQAQAPAQTAPAVKLYILDLGQLKSANPQPLLDRGVTVTDMSVVAYLIVHPRGTLLWDSGTIPDARKCLSKSQASPKRRRCIIASMYHG